MSFVRSYALRGFFDGNCECGGSSGGQGDSVAGFYVETIETEIEASPEVTKGVGDFNANMVSLSGYGTFWQLHTAESEEVHALVGKTLKSMRIGCSSEGGRLTVFGSDKVSTSQNWAEMQNEKTVLFRIVNSTAGYSTYMLDGTDPRVEIPGDSVIMPTSIGFYEDGVDTTFFIYDSTGNNMSYNGTAQFSANTGAVGTGSTSLVFSVVAKIDETEIVRNDYLVLELQEGRKLKVDLRDLGADTAPDKYAGLKGKKVSFIGDSITTFAGYNPPGYEICYPLGDITSVEQTWWWQLIDKSGMELHMNASWSGSTASSSWHGGTSNGSAQMAASTQRIQDLAKNGVSPDIVIVLIGINDFGHNADIGSWNAGPLPAEGTINTFSDAYALMVSKILATYPNAEVFCCTLPESPLIYDDITPNVWPVSFADSSGNTVTLQDYNHMIRHIAEAMGVSILDMHACGLNYFNYTHFYIDGLHPNAEGAKLMAKKALSELLVKSRYSQAQPVHQAPKTENWVFTLADGSTVTKAVCVG